MNYIVWYEGQKMKLYLVFTSHSTYTWTILSRETLQINFATSPVKLCKIRVSFNLKYQACKDFLTRYYIFFLTKTKVKKNYKMVDQIYFQIIFDFANVKKIRSHICRLIRDKDFVF